MKIDILHRNTQAVLYSGEFNSIKECVEAAVKDKVSLANADLHGVYLANANLAGADLVGASLKGSILNEADLSNANLGRANLSGAILRNAYLLNTDLTNAQLLIANLNGANLQGANLEEAMLYGANLKGADLVSANFENADLTGANLEATDLKRTILRGANISGTNLKGAINSDLTTAKKKNPEPSNEDRAGLAWQALSVFADKTGINLQVEPDSAITDLLCNMMHYCDQNAIDFNQMLDNARCHYNYESAPTEDFSNFKPS